MAKYKPLELVDDVDEVVVPVNNIHFITGKNLEWKDKINLKTVMEDQHGIKISIGEAMQSKEFFVSRIRKAIIIDENNDERYKYACSFIVYVTGDLTFKNYESFIYNSSETTFTQIYKSNEKTCLIKPASSRSIFTLFFEVPKSSKSPRKSYKNLRR